MAGVLLKLGSVFLYNGFIPGDVIDSGSPKDVTSSTPNDSIERMNVNATCLIWRDPIILATQIF